MMPMHYKRNIHAANRPYYKVKAAILTDFKNEFSAKWNLWSAGLESGQFSQVLVNAKCNVLKYLPTHAKFEGNEKSACIPGAYYKRGGDLSEAKFK